MFRIWCKCFDGSGHLLRDTVIEDGSPDISRTRKIFDALDKVCVEFDLSRPIWLDSNVAAFKRYSKVRFTEDNFIDTIDFAYLEIEVIEED